MTPRQPACVRCPDQQSLSALDDDKYVGIAPLLSSTKEVFFSVRHSLALLYIIRRSDFIGTNKR